MRRSRPVRPAPCAVIALALLTASACHTDFVIAPDGTRFSGAYVFRVETAAACAGRTSPPPLPVFDIPVATRPPSGGRVVLVSSPPAGSPCAAGNLALDLRVDDDVADGRVSGASCFTSGGTTWTARFSSNEVSPGAVHGGVDEGPGGRSQVVDGTLSGLVEVRTAFSSQGGECLAADHRWSLLAR